MIYAESLRHLVQEWIKVTPPAPGNPWPWNPADPTYLINFYAVPDGRQFTPETPPIPFISVVLSDINMYANTLEPDLCLYPAFFDRDSYALPRRYMHGPGKGLKNDNTSRFEFSTNTYEKMLYLSSVDTALVRILGDRPHQRHCCYGSDLYAALRNRLNEMGAEDGCDYRCAEDLFDCGHHGDDDITPSPETMLIQCPIVGYLKSTPRSKEYRIINGVFTPAPDHTRLSIPSEPCSAEYDKVRQPFADRKGQAGIHCMGVNEDAIGVAYVAVEVPCGVFSLQEFRPHDTIIVQGYGNEIPDGRRYTRFIMHQFMVYPSMEVRRMEPILGARLRHIITEGMIPVATSTKQFNGKHKSKLFYRSNLPNGYFRRSDGSVEVEMKVENDDRD